VPGLTYLDSSAIVKLVVEEPESQALRVGLRGRPQRVSSALALVEVTLAASRRDPAPPPGRVSSILAGLALVPIDRSVLKAAAGLAHLQLRALDAIHIATCVSLGADLDVLIAYDHRLLAAASGLGLPTEQPT
jgi:predicted nucleic acid-binding protein